MAVRHLKRYASWVQTVQVVDLRTWNVERLIQNAIASWSTLCALRIKFYALGSLNPLREVFVKILMFTETRPWMYGKYISRRHTLEIVYEKLTYIGGTRTRKRGQYRGKSVNEVTLAESTRHKCSLRSLTRRDWMSNIRKDEVTVQST